MKKMYYLFAVLLIGIASGSCDKENIDQNLVNLKTAYVQSTSTPISYGGNEPVILAVDKPRGGNVTCTDVSQAFDNVVLLCGDKIDYVDEVKFEGSFPEWLNVDVNGIYISFHMDECVKINDKYYKVGAVIVKGGNAANVYFYEGGTLSDSHLAAPGDKYMVSNLTFCFIECEEDLVIMVKAWYNNNTLWGGTVGTRKVFSTPWCSRIGIYDYPFTDPLVLENPYSHTNIGLVYLIDGKIKICLNEGLSLDRGYIYIGTEDDLINPENLLNGVCPDYENDWAPYIDWDPNL